MKTIKTLFFICCLFLTFNSSAQQQASIEEARMAAAKTLNLSKVGQLPTTKQELKKLTR